MATNTPPSSAFGLPTTPAEWDEYVRRERVRQGLSAELSAETAHHVAAILVRSRYPAAAQVILRASQRRVSVRAGQTVIDGSTADTTARLSASAA